VAPLNSVALYKWLASEKHFTRWNAFSTLLGFVAPKSDGRSYRGSLLELGLTSVVHQLCSMGGGYKGDSKDARIGLQIMQVRRTRASSEESRRAPRFLF
jgi:hypothetical protein